MSLYNENLENKSFFKYLLIFGISHVKKTIRSSFQLLGVEEIAIEFFNLETN